MSFGLPGKVLKAIGTIASNDPTRENLNYVHILPKEEKVLIEATNGRVACRLITSQSVANECFIRREICLGLKAVDICVFTDTSFLAGQATFPLVLKDDFEKKVKDQSNSKKYPDLDQVLPKKDVEFGIPAVDFACPVLLSVFKMIHALEPKYAIRFNFLPNRMMFMQVETAYGNLEVVVMGVTRVNCKLDL